MFSYSAVNLFANHYGSKQNKQNDIARNNGYKGSISRLTTNHEEFKEF